ncbi:MAG: DegT/DnrJ/EryC1/StrS family aminotransferase [Aggregatilineales bacterium]
MMPALALLGGEKAKSKPFPPWPHYDERELEALRAVLESRRWWRTPGDQTLRFEQAFAAAHGAKYGVAVTNGTHAIEVALGALGIGYGDEVIVPDFTFIATASAVLSVGALPVLVDIDAHMYNIDPAQVEAAITPRTKAIIVVHMGGLPVDMDALLEIGRRHNLPIIEDSSHAHGSEWKGQRIGALGIAGTFSFQASKTMTAGEGGIVITNDAEVERLARSISDCGRMPGHQFYEHFIYASNYRLSEWQGAVLNVQLERMDEQTARRHHNACILDGILREIDGITPQKHDERCTRNGHYLYMFHYDARAFDDVPPARFIEALNAEGIPTQATYPPLHALEVFSSGAYKTRIPPGMPDDALRHAPFSNSAMVMREVICLPQAVLLSDEADMEEIGVAIRKIQANTRELHA